MINVEQKIIPGAQWGEPLEKNEKLQAERVGHELHVTASLPRYDGQGEASDLMAEYEKAAKYRAPGKRRASNESPEVLFANAETDEKLIAFVRQFGPVVAKCAYTNFEKPEKGLLEPRLPPRLFAIQDMQELRNEHLIYRSATALNMELTKSKVDFETLHGLIGEIAKRIAQWPEQWEREKRERKREPLWILTASSFDRINQLASTGSDAFLPPALNARIVLCELVNSFPPLVFPNLPEIHASIKYGIRPLLYAILRRQIVSPRDFSLCANTHCRNFFNIERSGQRFCTNDCSIHQRQRDYWTARGKKLREKKRTKQRRAKIKKAAS